MLAQLALTTGLFTGSLKRKKKVKSAVWIESDTR